MALTFPPRWRFAGWLAVILLVTLQLYAPHLDHAFQYDDDKKLLESRDLDDPMSYFEAFGAGGYSEHAARLLPNLTFAANYALFELEPWGWHLTNLLLHLVVVVLVALFGRALAKRAGEPDDMMALLAAGLFAVHPLNSEAVNYCNARPNVMVAIFYLLGLLAVLRATDPAVARGPGRIAAWGGFGLALVSALLCKELSVTLVVMVPLLLWWFRAPDAGPVRLSKRVVVTAAVLVAVGGAILASTGAFAEVRHSVLEKGSQVTGHWFTYLVVTMLGQSEVFLRYFGLAVLPWPGFLNIDHREIGHLFTHLYRHREVVDGAFEVVLPPLASFAVVLAVLRGAFAWRRRAALVTFLVLWPFVTHATTWLVPRGEVMVEYRTYLPMVGICLGLALGLRRLGAWIAQRLPEARARMVLRVGTALLVSLLTVGTSVRNRAWATPEAMWLDSLRKAPDNPRALNGLGNAARLAGHEARAIELFQRAVDADPTYVEAQNNLGAMLAQKGDLEGALRHLARVVRLAPDQADAFNNVGNVFAKLGRYDEAIIAYRRALEIDPKFGEAEANLGMSVARKGDREAALAHYRRAVELSPRFAIGHLLIGRALLARGDVDAALESFRRALALAPEDPRVHVELGKALGYRHDSAGARRHLLRALELEPGNSEARAYLETLPGG